VVGIDASTEMITFAQQSFPAMQYPNLSFYSMDATAIDLPHTFDLAFSNAALHWVINHRAVLQSIRSHLRPDGRILFQMGGRGNVSELLRVVNEIIAAPKWQGYFKGFHSPYWFFHGPEEYQVWLRETGLERFGWNCCPVTCNTGVEPVSKAG
jgi:trans-aconitate 2-methyltransferase